MLAGAFLFASHSPQAAVAGTPLPEGAIHIGTLAGPTLLNDAVKTAQMIFTNKGCSNATGLNLFIAKPFSGEVGSRTWEEIWTSQGCEVQVKLQVLFNEDGKGGAYFTIR